MQSSVLDYEPRPWNEPPRRPFIVIGSITTAIMIVLAIVAKVPNYHTAPVLLVPIVWGVYLLRRKLYLTPLLFGMFCSAMLLHNMGAFGCYQRSYFGFSFDHYVHFWFGIVGTLALRRAMGIIFPTLRTWQLSLMTLLFVMGIGAIHEIIEFCSYLLLGEERGMLKPHTSDFFDTQKDLSNNLLGALTALLFAAIFMRRGNRKDLR